MSKNRLFRIPKKVVWDAVKQAKKGWVIGINRRSIRSFGLQPKRLHELWEQMSSGKYVPAPVRRAYRRKPTGGWRPLGIPTVRDHVVQTLLRDHLSSRFNGRWHPNSFLHLRGKKARRAVLETARKRCLRYNWALILDIKKYGDNIDHRILMNMLKKHFDNPWVLLYTHRMLKVPAQLKNGTLERRNKGLPHDNSLSFFLADFYLHDIFDQWMKKNHPHLPFERYVDDIIIHCRSEAQAKALLSQVTKRFKQFKLEKNKKKTKVVYCKDGNRKGSYKNISFNFLEYTFRSRTKKLRSGKRIALFGPQ